MKKILLSALMTAACLAAGAQTARQFTLPLSDDGVAQLVVYLPEQPTGMPSCQTPMKGPPGPSSSMPRASPSPW